MAQADKGENPAAHKIAEGAYQFSLLESAHYTISAWEDLDPQRAPSRRRKSAASVADDPAAEECAAPARLEAPPIVVDGADRDTKEIALVFATPECTKQ
jgi:hypothetical protein